MVLVPSTNVGEELQAALRGLGLEVPLYHSKLGDAWERQELVKRFLGQSRPTVDHHLHQCLWYGARRAERPPRDPLAAVGVG